MHERSGIPGLHHHPSPALVLSLWLPGLIGADPVFTHCSRVIDERGRYGFKHWPHWCLAHPFDLVSRGVPTNCMKYATASPF